jgi:hypothetical protein
LPDVGAGGELGEFGEEFGGEIGGVGRSGLRLGMAETITGVSVHDGKLTAATAVCVMAATRAIGGAGFGSLVVHFRFLGRLGVYTPMAMERVRKHLKAKELQASIAHKSVESIGGKGDR